jgi:hypothetical protein
MMWLGVMDFALLFIMLYAGTVMLAFMIFGLMAVAGCLAGKLVSVRWAMVYFGMIIALMVMRLAIVLFVFDVTLLVLTLLFLLLDILILILDYRYIQLLKQLTEDDRKELRRFVTYC